MKKYFTIAVLVAISFFVVFKLPIKLSAGFNLSRAQDICGPYTPINNPAQYARCVEARKQGKPFDLFNQSRPKMPLTEQPPDVCPKGTVPPGWTPGGPNAPKPGDPGYPEYSQRLKCWSYGVTNNPGYTKTKKGTYCVFPYITDAFFYDGPDFNQQRFNLVRSLYYRCLSDGGGVASLLSKPLPAPPPPAPPPVPPPAPPSLPIPEVTPRITTFLPLAGRAGDKTTVWGADLAADSRLLIAGTVITPTAVASDGRSLEFRIPGSLEVGAYRLQIIRPGGMLSDYSKRLLTVIENAADPTVYYVVPLKMKRNYSYNTAVYGTNFSDIVSITPDYEGLSINDDSIVTIRLTSGKVQVKFRLTVSALTPTGPQYLTMEDDNGNLIRFPVVVR